MRFIAAYGLRISLILTVLLPFTALAENNTSAVVALISFNPTLGDLNGNISKIEELVTKAVENGASIVVVPEQATTGFNITKQQALNGLAITNPFDELSRLFSIAEKNGVFITLGIVERVSNSDVLYNTALVIQPSGVVSVQRKRLASSASFGWNSRGDTPFDVYPTPWGDIAVLICADSFLMDWVRIATIKGADIILLPSNWWGSSHQVELWRARAKQDGVWILAANRWGQEPNSFPPPGNYYMSDGPTAAVTPLGLPVQAFEADDASALADAIIYQTISVPTSRLGGPNPTFSVAYRRPSAYQALANAYYVPPANTPIPGLPAPGLQPVEVLAYQPGNDPTANLQMVSSTLGSMAVPPDSLIVLPGLGLTPAPLDPVGNPAWYKEHYWQDVAALVKQHDAQGLVTSVLVRPTGSNRTSLAVAFIGGDSAILYPQIHDSGDLAGSGAPSPVLMLKHAAVALMTGIDSLFPEIGADVAKRGADIAVVISTLSGQGTAALEAAGIENSLPRAWSVDDLTRQWQVMANGCMHVVASDTGGFGFVANQADYCLQGQTTTTSFTPLSVSLDTTSQRKKSLNWYYDFDLQTLLN